MVRYSVPIPDSEVERLLSNPGVNSVSEGVEGGERVIVIGVVDRQTKADNSFPGQIDGFPVIVEVEGTPTPQPDIPLPGGPMEIPQPSSIKFATRSRPVPAGVSIAHKDVTAGTSSFLATDGAEIFGLSNNHVLAKWGDAKIGDSILQPGPFDGGSEEDEIGKLAGKVDVGGGSNKVDLAWYRPNASADVSGEIIEAGVPSAQKRDPELGDTVMFAGRSSGIQTAKVDRVNVTTKVGQQQELVFVDQFRIDKQLIPGDSGAPIFHGDGKPIPAGIGFASTRKSGYCNPISAVEEQSGLTVISSADPRDADNGGGGGPNISKKQALAGGALLAAYYYRDELL